MTGKWLSTAMGFALCWIASAAGYTADLARDPGQPRAFDAATLAKVTPGETTKTQVEALLGQPWRTTFSDDSDEPGPVVWEYRGRDASGTYSIHVEFDSHDVTTLIAKIPDTTEEAPARVAKTPPQPAKP